jgi:photosystem II stability/assembly factor-like uncharacterized protein
MKPIIRPLWLGIFLVFCTAAKAAENYYLPQVADGQFGTKGMRTTFILFNPTKDKVSGALSLKRDDGGPLTVTLSGAGATTTGDTFPFTLESGATSFFQTSGSGSLQAGAALVTSSSEIGVSAAFSVYMGEAFLTETGVGPSQPMTEFVLPVEAEGPYSTGLAIFNLNSASTQITFLLLDRAGRAAAGPLSLTLGPEQHMAKFITGLGQLFPSLSTFHGTLLVTSTRPVAAMTLRQHEDPLSYTSLPVVPIPSNMTEFLLPQVANGGSEGGTCRTTFLLFNVSSEQATVDITLTKDDGTELPVSIEGMGDTRNTWSIPLAPGGSASLQTSGLGPLQVGAARVVSTVPVGVAGIFTITDSAGAFVTETGVSNSPAGTEFTMPVDATGSFDTGVAFFKPGAGSVSLSIRLLDENGIAMAPPKEIVLASNAHLARFVSEFFPGGNSVRGSLSVTASGPVAALALRQCSTPLGFTTLPVVPGAFAGLQAPTTWTTLFKDDFEGGLADYWQPSGGSKFGIETDSGNAVLSLEGPQQLLLKAGPWTDYRFSVKIKLVENGEISLHYRSLGCASYSVGFVPNRIEFGRRSADCEPRSLLAGLNETHAIGTWYTVEIVGLGSWIRVYVDGQLKFDYVDAAPLTLGGILFEATVSSFWPTAHVHIDSVEITGSVIEWPSWVRTGGPPGGLGYDVRMRMTSPDIMYVTDTFSGVGKSLDGGRTWLASNSGITSRTGSTGDSIPIFCLTVDPNNPDIIWAGTQNMRGIFKSTDGGKAWVQKDKGVKERTGIAFRGFTVDPRNSDVVYAAAEISSWEWAGQERKGIYFDLTKGVLYKTIDGGENWAELWRGDNLARYIWIDPRDSNVIYVSTGIFDREAANSDPLRKTAGGVGILKSTDGGQTWRVLNQENGLQSLYIGSLFMHPDNPDILLAGAGSDAYPEGSGVYLSIDKGEHWEWVPPFPSLPLWGGKRIMAVEYATSNSQIAYAAGQEAIYRSEDSGRTWRLMSGGPPNFYYGPAGQLVGIPIDLQVDPRNPDVVFINNYGGGNFVTKDGGRTWEAASKGYTGAQLHDISIDPRDHRRAYTIGRTGPFRTIDGGETWQGLLPDEPGAGVAEWNSIALDPANPDVVFMSAEYKGTLYRSYDDGSHWEIVLRSAQFHPGSDSGQGFKSIAFAPSNAKVVYAGMRRNRAEADSGNPGPSFGILRSVDGGETWQDANDGNTATQNINVLAVDPRNESLVYAGSIQGGVFSSNNGGQTWQARNEGLGILDVRALAVDPREPNVIYAGIAGGAVYKTIDRGGHWTSSSNGMDPEARILDIVLDPTNPQVIYAADTQTGIYRSVDGGKFWLQLNLGLHTRAVSALAISKDGGTLYAATYGEGVFRLDLKPLTR